jgi:hypothetical protein
VRIIVREAIPATLPNSLFLFKRYGILRLLRDIFGISEFIETNERGEIKALVLNKGSALARCFILAFKTLLGPHAISVELGNIQGSSSLRHQRQ